MWDVKLKRTVKSSFVVLRGGQYEILARAANLLRVRVLEADGMVINAPPIVTFHLSKKGYFYVNGGCENTQRKNVAGKVVTYAIRA